MPEEKTRKSRPRRAAGRTRSRGAGPKAERTLTVVQVHSGIGCPERQRLILASLGLRGPRDRRQLPDHPTIRGMVAKISHLVRIEEPAARAGSKA